MQATEDNSIPSSSDSEVAVFITCLVNQLRPGLGFATAALLQSAGFRVTIPAQQTCCGQPNYNNGDPHHARLAAQHHIAIFAQFNQVVVPSASCAGMIKNHYPALFKADDPFHEKAKTLAEKTWEVSDFLVHFGLANLPSNPHFQQTVTHHDSCSALREMAVTAQVRQLVKHCLPHCRWVELADSEVCCGFGGTFCTKFNAISQHMGRAKLKCMARTEADYATSLDLGCLLQLQSLQEVAPLEPPIKLRHLIELLAEQLDSIYES